jgi:hypothetical protein
LASAAQSVDAIATAARAWEAVAEEASCVPPPPIDVELVFEPNASLERETQRNLRRLLAGKRVRVVGGSRNDRSVRELLEAGAARVDWPETERRKRAKPEETWARVDPSKDICVIVTGWIGHAVSENAAAACKRAGVNPVYVKDPQQVARAVVADLIGT